MKNIRNANEWESLALRYFCNLTAHARFPPLPVTPSKELFSPRDTCNYRSKILGEEGRKEGREERAGIEVAVIKKSGKLRAGSIRFGGKKGIDEGKKLFRNGNNGGWNAFLREMRLQEAAGEQRFLITISNSDTPENICTPRFLSSIKDCYIGAKIVLEFRVYFENRFNLLFYM